MVRNNIKRSVVKLLFCAIFMIPSVGLSEDVINASQGTEALPEGIAELFKHTQMIVDQGNELLLRHDLLQKELDAVTKQRQHLKDKENIMLESFLEQEERMNMQRGLIDEGERLLMEQRSALNQQRKYYEKMLQMFAQTDE
jgi:hypothetical protein